MQIKLNEGRRDSIKKIIALGSLTIGWPRNASAIGSTLINKKSAANESEAGKGFTVLFQGDSITDGNRSRNSDWNHVMGHGYAYIIASRLWYDYPSKGYHFFNRGISGNKVSDLTGRWEEDTVAIKPDLLSILIGVNDLNSFIDKSNPHPVSAVSFEEGYRALLKETKEKLPNTQIVICEPFILPVGTVKDNWETWSGEMKTRQEIVKRISAETGTTFVGLQDAFNKACEKAPADYWIWDGIHPMPAGHELIARSWIHVVKKRHL